MLAFTRRLPWRSIVLAAASIGLFVTFCWAAFFYASSDAAVARAPGVVNLANHGLVSKIAFGTSPACGGGRECWLEPSFDDHDWQAVALPRFDLRTHPEYAHGLEAGWVYYRLSFPVPSELKAATEVLSFSPRVILHQAYQVFLDGHEIHAGNGSDYIGATANIPLPAAVATRTTPVQMVIKAKLAPGDEGIHHRGGLLIGPKTSLDRFHLATEREMGTYFLLFLLAKGSIFILFALIYVLSDDRKNLGTFLVYALCTTLENLVAGNFLADLVPFHGRCVAFFGLRSVAIWALFAFIAVRLELAIPLRWMRILGATATAGILAAAIAYARGVTAITVPTLYSLVNGLLWIAMGAGLIFGLAKRHANVDDRRCFLRRARDLLIFLGIYFGVLSWQLYFAKFQGITSLSLLDLLFSYFIVVGIIRDFNADHRLLVQRNIELANTRVDSAVARTAQMLAHDIRAPFATLRMTMDVLEEGMDPANMAMIKHQVLPALDQRLAMVDGMIADILEASSTSALTLAAASPRLLLSSTMKDMLSLHAGADVSISYQLLHRHMILVDQQKIRRVLGNVVENALQAVAGRGKLWLQTAEIVERGKAFVSFTIGNSGSFIEPDAVGKVFEVFYTKGKSGGTGLGLAIAKKVVDLHGGRIWCTSSESLGTEFHLSLPVDPSAVDDVLVELPRRGADFLAARAKVGKRSVPLSLIEASEDDICRQTEAIARASQAVATILIVDDEATYIRGLEALMRASPVIAAHLAILQARNANDALSKVATAVPDLIICDVDLGCGSSDGLELVRELRRRGVTATICVHSNSQKPADYRRAVEAGADSFMPKPLSRTHFYAMVGEILRGKLDPSPPSGMDQPSPLLFAVEAPPSLH